MKNRSFFLLFFCTLFCWQHAEAQTEVKGRVTDARTREPLPFANVLFTGTSIGVTTDFDGNFRLVSSENHKSVTVSYIGYIKATRAIRPGESQVVEIKLEEDAESLKEVVITPGKKKKRVNPAHAIIDQAAANKNQHNRNSLLAYEYEAYNKIELSLQKMAEKTQNRKIIQNIQSAYDSIHHYTNEDGESLMPVFLSESISKYYFRNKPMQAYEHILHTNVRGIGIDDGSILSQVLGTSFQQYNFYDNWLNILGKEFVSPIADGWKLYYDYELQDSVKIGEDMCFKIKVAPKRKQDLAFHGTLWITKKDHALKQLDLQVLPEANLNFVHKISISQQFVPTDTTAWLPEKIRVVMDVRQPGQIGSGLLAKFYISSKNIEVNKAHPSEFYSSPLTVEDRASDADQAFWQANRHDSLSYEELKVVQMIDSANKLPSVRRTIGILKVIGSGFVRVSPKLEIGPWTNLYSYNDVEGHRMGIGFRTSNTFSRNYRLRGMLAYGTRDNRLKYKLYSEQIISRKTWTRMRIFHSSDLEQVGMDPEDVNGTNYLFFAANRLGRLRMPYRFQNTGMLLQTDLIKGITARLQFNYRYFTPVFPFIYRETDTSTGYSSTFSTSEIMLETRITRRETFIKANFDRISTGTRGWPILTLRYAYGIPQLLGSDFEYHRFGLVADQRINLAFLGVSKYTLELGKYIGTLPFPLLEVHMGNESPISALSTYNMMNVAEFASDTYASLRYQHSFEGLLLNRIPLMRKLKWRAVGYGNILWGHLSEVNSTLVAPLDPADTQYIQPQSLNKLPYIELGYGIENIFKFFRVDAFHRLTYLDNPNARPFGVKVGFAIEL